MVAQISAYGRLVADVQSRTTSNGGNMAFARMAVSLPYQKAENGEMTFWLGVTAFGKQAELSARHKKGDLLSVSGTMQVSQWTGKTETHTTAIRWLWMRLSVPERSNHPVGKDSKAKPPTHYNGLKNRFSITVRAGLSMNSQKSCLMMSCHFKLSVNMHFGY